MKVVAFVPVKMNNERFPGKNTKQFKNGRPLISYILNTLLKVSEIDEIYVYCSDEKIKDYLPKGITFFKRDNYLDLSTTSFNEVLTTFAEEVSADIYVLTHATAPFIKPKTFQEGINAVLSKEYDSSLSVQRLQEFLWYNGKPINYDLNRIPRTQELPVYYKETCGMYIYTKEIINNGRRIGSKPFLVEVDQVESVDINYEEDFMLAEAILNTL